MLLGSGETCLAYLVCSPRLLEINAYSIAQMRLANALCRFVELADPTAGQRSPSDGVAMLRGSSHDRALA